MSIIIPVDVDTSIAESKMQAVDGNVKKLDKDIEAKKVKAMTYWSYINQLSSMGLNMLARSAKGELEVSLIRLGQNAQQIAMAETSVVQMTIQSIAAFGMGDLKHGAFFASLAAAMQATIVSSQIQRQANERIQQNAADIAQQLEAYRI